MINFYLVVAITVFMLWLVPAGTCYFEKEGRRLRAREKAQKQYRWCNGVFAKKRTITDLLTGRNER